MSYYVIGIGGTGAKCVEALTHLCAAGVLPPGELYAVFVDPDKANGSLERAEITLQQYANCRKIGLGATDLFKTEITRAKPDVWSPFGNEPNPRLDGFFRYEGLKSNEPAAAHLFDVLYSRDEKTTPLEEGFRGHPSIGAAIMASTLQLGADEPWKTFRNKIGQDLGGGPGAKIALIGSIFGGTGASGIPTIARMIREELRLAKKSQEKGKGEQEKNSQAGAKLGGILMLPYFSFTPVEDEKLRADSENFLLSTQAALKYYYQQDDLRVRGDQRVYDGVYLIGEQNLSPMKESSVGGKTQRNEPHFVEIYAALACVDFYAKENVKEYQMIARQAEGTLRWNDLPYIQGPDMLSQKLNQLARFAFAYLCSYYPMLDHINKAKSGYRAPWYVNFFARPKVDLAQKMREELLHMKEYCESFLRWFANIQSSAKEIKSELVNYSAFARKEKKGDKESIALLPPAEFKTSEFGNLTLLRPEEDPNGLNRLWERMSNAKVRDNDATDIGKFIQALYRECKEK
ncbi:MAG: hypothetical protein V7641_1785 [Blastocatellia bacterium]